MRETRLSGSEGGGASDSPYPYDSPYRYAIQDCPGERRVTAQVDSPQPGPYI